MSVRSKLLIGSVLAGIAASFGLAQAAGKAAGEAAITVAATPVGIGLQPLGAGQGAGLKGQGQISEIGAFDVGYADEHGRTLYTFDGDKEGVPTCAGECAATWAPALAPVNAKPIPGWSTVARADGAKQWAYMGKPLYTSTKDKVPGSVGGVLATGGRAARGRSEIGAKAATALPDGWHTAVFSPASEIAMPAAISMREVGDANGMVLVDANDRTIYAYSGDLKRDGTACAKGGDCGSTWKPVVAPQAAVGAIGDFSTVLRKDGIRQWAYKAKPLYTFAGDLSPDYANGQSVDPRWQVAVVRAYFMPPEVKVGDTPGRGKVLTTASGLTLYRRDAHAYQTGGGHSLRHGLVVRPAVGREVGERGCSGECLKTWHPLAASPSAQSSGYWEILDRKDGIRQWAYRGFPLYTYDQDKKPGDMAGNDIYEMFLSDDPKVVNHAGSEQVGIASLYWTIAIP